MGNVDVLCCKQRAHVWSHFFVLYVHTWPQGVGASSMSWRQDFCHLQLQKVGYTHLLI